MPLHGGGAPARADPLDPLANFIRDQEHLSSMSDPDISALVSELQMPRMVIWEECQLTTQLR